MTSKVTTAHADQTVFIDQNHAARILGLKNPKTLAVWRGRRCGPQFFKIGKRMVRYDRAAVLAWATARPVG